MKYNEQEARGKGQEANEAFSSIQSIKIKKPRKFRGFIFYILLSYFLLPLASCLLPLASCLLPLASCLLPLASCLLPLAFLFWQRCYNRLVHFHRIPLLQFDDPFFIEVILIIVYHKSPGVFEATGLALAANFYNIDVS